MSGLGGDQVMGKFKDITIILGSPASGKTPALGVSQATLRKRIRNCVRS